MNPHVEIKKSLLGKLTVKYDCPKCTSRLTSPSDDVGTTDTCPDCHAQFTVPGTEELNRWRIKESRRTHQQQELREQYRRAAAAQVIDARQLPEPPPVVKRNLVQSLTITLTSGAQYDITHIMLYDGVSIERTQRLHAEAMNNLQRVSTGIGFWGSPGWVIGGSLALSLLEQAASDATAKKGVQQLDEVASMREIIRDGGQFVPIADIENIDNPIPSLWRAIVQRVATKQPVFTTNAESVLVPLVHHGEPFVRIRVSDASTLFIAWERVEQYVTKP